MPLFPVGLRLVDAVNRRLVRSVGAENVRFRATVNNIFLSVLMLVFPIFSFGPWDFSLFLDLRRKLWRILIRACLKMREYACKWMKSTCFNDVFWDLLCVSGGIILRKKLEMEIGLVDEIIFE